MNKTPLRFLLPAVLALVLLTGSAEAATPQPPDVTLLCVEQTQNFKPVERYGQIVEIWFSPPKLIWNHINLYNAEITPGQVKYWRHSADEGRHIPPQDQSGAIDRITGAFLERTSIPNPSPPTEMYNSGECSLAPSQQLF
jgi:hypothetical protein